MADRKTDLERGALADFTLDLHAPPVRAHDCLGLKEADAEAFLLGALKWAEEGSADERLTHAAAVICDRQDDPIIPELGGYSNPPVRPKGIARVEDKVRHHALQLFTVGQDRGQRVKVPG